MQSKTDTGVPSQQQSSATRLASLDQFRGYTVIGMLLVNYFAGYQAAHRVLKHTHDYCSYADLIMPQFLFAVGFAMRLTFGRRMAREGNLSAYVRMAKRLLGLVLVSLVVYSVSPRAANWAELVELGVWGAIQEPLKRQWFQTLMHIAVTSLWILPVIHASIRTRVVWVVLSVLIHIVISHQFNFIWTNTSPNAIDGGPFAFLTWSVPAILGSIVCDWFVPNPGTSKHSPDTQILETQNLGPQNTLNSVSIQPSIKRNADCDQTTGCTEALYSAVAIKRSLVVGVALMVVAYLLSCGTRLYDVDSNFQPIASDTDDTELTIHGHTVDQSSNVATVLNKKIAAYPVIPLWDQWASKRETVELHSFFAEPPLIPPPDSNHRKWNYWMMSQRAGTATYTIFAAGFSAVLFALFYQVCDRWGFQLPLFTTFGTNALLAYVLHGLVSEAVRPFFPKDSPTWYAMFGLALFFLVNWLILRSLQKQGVFVRV